MLVGKVTCNNNSSKPYPTKDQEEIDDRVNVYCAHKNEDLFNLNKFWVHWRSTVQLVRQLLLVLELLSTLILFGLNWLSPKQVHILWDLIEGRVPSPTWKKCPVCHRFSTDTLTEQPEAAGCRNRHLLNFYQSPFSQVAALILLGARPIRLG